MAIIKISDAITIARKALYSDVSLGEVSWMDRQSAYDTLARWHKAIGYLEEAFIAFYQDEER
jgi:hypothetical protein